MKRHDLNEGYPGDKAQANKVKDVLLALANAVSAVKLFPSDHTSARNFIDDLAAKLKVYLEEHGNLELGIKEDCFTFEGQPVYEDSHPVRSLPFFFFKDGMQALLFYPGVEKEELKNFLETIKTVSLLPPEEGDIVNALWEKDFANIRYIAPDEFLEAKILGARESIRIKVDRTKLTTGRIDLTPEDLEEIARSRLVLMEKESSTTTAAEGRGDEPGPLSDFSQTAVLDENDMLAIESLLQSNRRVSADEEFVNLIVEIIYLEDQPERFPAILEALRESHRELIKRKNYAKACLLLEYARELEGRFSRAMPQKSEILRSFLKETTTGNSLDIVKASFDNQDSGFDLDSFFRYLFLLGKESLYFLSDLFELSSDRTFRSKTLDHLKIVGQHDVETLINVAVDTRPSLTMELIPVISQTRDKRAISFLAGFLRSHNKQLKLEAIKALGLMPDRAVNKILVAFLSDET